MVSPWLGHRASLLSDSEPPDSEEVCMARLRFWLERLMEARRAKRDALLFARIIDEREARRMTLNGVG